MLFCKAPSLGVMEIYDVLYSSAYAWLDVLHDNVCDVKYTYGMIRWTVNRSHCDF